MMRNTKWYSDREPATIEVPITAAIRVAGTDEIGSVHVVTNRRPTYAELVRYRQEAAQRDVTLSVAASGITARPPFRGGAWRSRAGLLPSVPPPLDWRRISPALHWLHAHGRAWRAELVGMTEGTR